MPLPRRVVTVGVAAALVGAAVSAVTWAATTRHGPASRPTGPIAIRSLVAASVVTGAKATMTATATPATTSVSGDLHGRRVAFSRHGRSWTATLHRGAQLRAGANNVIVTASGAGLAAQRSATVYLTGVRRTLGLVVRDGSAGSAAAVDVSTERAVAKLAVTVNGTELPNRLDNNLHAQRIALGAGDGLRAGRNTIVVSAVDANGGWQRRTLVETVDRAAPMAEAGADSRGRVGVATKLDASRSRVPAHKTARYRWTVVQRPKGSTARLRNASAVRPSFTPDVGGRYRFRVAVTAGGHTTADSTAVTVPMYVPPGGALIQTQVASGSSYAITYQGRSVVTMPQGVAGESMLAVYDRATLVPLGAVSAGPTQVSTETALLNQARAIGGGNETPVVAVISVAAGNGSAVAPLLSSLGITEDANMSAGNAFSVVVVTGATPYLVWRSTNSSDVSTRGHQVGPGNLTGYLQATAGGVGPFTFVPQAHLPFDTDASSTATSNTISLGCPGRLCVSRPSPPLTTCSGATNPGGFQVLVAAAGTLRTTVNKTFTTNDGCSGPADATADTAAVTAIGTLLAKYPANRDGSVDQLVIVQSIGTPRNVSTATQSGNWAALSDAWRSTAIDLVPYGATASEFAGIGNASPQGYALFGSTSLTLPGSDSPYGQEVAAGNPAQAPARLTGLLDRNHRNDFTPQVTAVGGAIDNALGTVLYQPATAWPDSSTPGEQNALAYITKMVGPTLGPGVDPDSGGECHDPNHSSFRDAYCNLALQTYWPSISHSLARLATKPLPVISPTTPQFSETDWTTVLTELSTETEKLPLADQLVDYLKLPFDGSKTSVQLGTIVSDVNAALNPPSTPVGGTSTWLGIVSDVLGLLWAVLPEPANAVAGVVSEGIALGSDLTTDSNGQPELATPIHDAADDLAGDLQSRYAAVAANIRYLYDVIVTDPAKLDVAADLMTTGGVTQVSVNSSIDALSIASKGWLYAHLLGSVFHPDLLTQANPKGPVQTPWQLYPGDASTFTCFTPEVSSGVYRPFSGAEASQQYSALQTSSLASGAVDARYVLAAPGTIHDFAPHVVRPALAPVADLTQLFGTPQLGVPGSGLGYDKAHFFERDLGLTSGTTQACQSEPTINGPLAAASATPDEQSVFFTWNGHLEGTTYSLSRDTWQGTPVLPGQPDGNSALAATSNGPGDLHVFYVAKGTITNDWRDSGTAWQGPATLPGTPDKGSPLAAVSTGSGAMFVFFLFKGQLTFDDYTTGAGWQGPVAIAGKPDGNSPLAAASFGPGDAHVFFLSGGKLQNVWSSGQNGWQGPGPLPGNPDRGNRSLAASHSPNGANVFFLTGGVPTNDYYGSNGWQGPVPLPGRASSSGLAAVRTSGPQPTRLFLSTGGSLYSVNYIAGSGWQQPVVVLSSGT